MACINMEQAQKKLILCPPPSTKSTWSELKAANWLLRMLWPGGCDVSCGGMKRIPDRWLKVKNVCMHAHVCAYPSKKARMRNNEGFMHHDS